MASFEKIPLRMIFTARRQYSKGVGNHLIHFLTGFTAFVDLMKNFSVFNKKYSGCVTGCLCTVCDHQNGLSLLVDLAKHGKKCRCSTGVECACRFISKNQFRVCDQCSCNSCTLFLAAGNFIWKFVQKLCNSKCFCNRSDLLLHFAVIFSGKYEWEINVVA